MTLPPKLNSYVVLFILGIGLLSSFSLTAQDQFITVRDFETWSGLQAEAKLNKRIKISGEQQLRLDNNSSDLQQTFSQLSGVYEWKNGWSLGAATRYALVAKDTVLQPRLRWNVDAGYAHELGRIDFKYRLRYQSRSVLTDSTSLAKNVLRAKVKMGYNIRDWKLDPAVAVEAFTETQTFAEPYKLRGTLSTSYKLSKSTSLSAFYRIETELFKTYPLTSHILGARLKYSFKTY